MRRNKSEPLLFDPEPELTIRRRRAHQRLVRAMEGNGGGGPDPAVEARIEAAVQKRLAQRLQEQQLRYATRSLSDQTVASLSYDYPGSVVYPNAEGQNFELKPTFISQVGQHQFGGSSLKDPHAHLERFVSNCSTCRVNNATQDSIRLARSGYEVTRAEQWQEECRGAA